jgi:hypothetical protein
MDFLSYSLVTPRGAFTSKNTEKKATHCAVFVYNAESKKAHIAFFDHAPIEIWSEPLLWGKHG